MIGEETYKKHFIELRGTILRCYKDIALLESIEQFSQGNTKEDVIASVKVGALHHICELAKIDLAMNIWKTYYDSTGQANTIGNLRNELVVILKSQNMKINLPKKQECTTIKAIERPLREMRNKLLAHMDKEREIDPIMTEGLIDVVELLKNELNGLAYSDLSDGIQPISNNEISLIKMRTSMGMNLMTAHSS